MLGGGGFTGGVYEIGALRALDLLSVNRTVNDFDIYVGTSAGSFVASLLAAGLTPEEMSRVVNRQVPTPFRDVDLGALLRPNYADFATRAMLMPLRLAGLGAQPRRPLARGLADGRRHRARGGAAIRACTPGAGIEKYIRETFLESDRTNDFRLLEAELYLTATDLDTCERVVFGVAGLGRRADLEGGLGLGRAADGLPAGRDQGPPVHRRRHPLDHQRRHRGRAGREVHRRRSTRSSPT